MFSRITDCISNASTFLGLGQTEHGTHQKSDGPKDVYYNQNLLLNMKSVFCALILTNMTRDAYTMKASLLSGTTGIGVSGITFAIEELQNLDFFETISGIGQAILGLGSTVIIEALDPDSIKRIHQTACVVLASSYVMGQAVKDLESEKYAIGCGKMLLGLTGYVYSGISFINTIGAYEYNNAIKYLSQVCPTENWKLAGQGVFKDAWTTPEMPDSIVKVPCSLNGFGRHCGEQLGLDKFRTQFSNVQKLQVLIKDYGSLIIPESQLIETQHGPVLIEKKYSFENYYNVPESFEKQQAEKELTHFISTNNLCDIRLREDHNAQFVSTDSGPKIVIYDVDNGLC